MPHLSAWWKKHFTAPATLALKLTCLRLHFDFSLLWVQLKENWKRFSVIRVSRPAISVSAGAVQGCASVSSYLISTITSILPEISLPFSLPQDLVYFLMNEYWFQETKESQTFHRWILSKPPWTFFCKPWSLLTKKHPQKTKPHLYTHNTPPPHPSPLATDSLEVDTMVWGYQLQPSLLETGLINYELTPTDSVNPLEFTSSQFEKPRQGKLIHLFTASFTFFFTTCLPWVKHVRGFR